MTNQKPVARKGYDDDFDDIEELTDQKPNTAKPPPLKQKDSVVSRNQKSFERKKSADALDEEYYDEEYYDEEEGSQKSPVLASRRKSNMSKEKSIEIIDQAKEPALTNQKTVVTN